MTRSRDIVTDHAVLRYLERVYGVDVNALRRRIELMTQEGRGVGAKAQVHDGVRYVFAEGRVVTVHGRNGEMSKRALRWKARRK